MTTQHNTTQPIYYELEASIKVIIRATGLSLIVTPTARYLSPCKKLAHLWQGADVKAVLLDVNEQSFSVNKNKIHRNICKCANLSLLTNQKLKLGFSFDPSNDYTLVEIQVG